MTGILAGLAIVEGSAFVAAPLGGMRLALLGADVIRYDQIGGGLDYGRWPLADNGQSLFWSGMNKGKRSIQVDLRRPEGQELVAALVARPGPGRGIFLTNLPARGVLAYEALKARRNDLIMVLLTGNRDGTSEVDYTVQAATGFPAISGPRGSTEPVNSVLPAWDIAMGEMAATGLLAAERHRSRTGQGSLVRLALSDVAFAMVANLGRLAQAQLGVAAEKDGNYLYGAFGGDFATADDRRIMVVALTGRQWKALKEATGIAAAGIATGEDLDTEGGRYAARDAISETLRPWFASRTLAEAGAALTAAGASWGPYRDFMDLVSSEVRISGAGSLFGPQDQPGIGNVLTPASPLDFSSAASLPPLRAPILGEHTDEILGEIGLDGPQIAALHDRGIVAGPKA